MRNENGGNNFFLRILNGLEKGKIWCKLENVRCGEGVENAEFVL